jgi:hypothetical protein
MKMIFSCPVQGDTFRPTEAERQSGIRFSEKNEIGELGKSGRYQGRPQPYGFGSFEAEIDHDDMDAPLVRFLEQVQHGLPIWRSLGANRVILQIDIFYDQQCNFELSEGVIAALHKTRLPVTISCYQEMKDSNQ